MSDNSEYANVYVTRGGHKIRDSQCVGMVVSIPLDLSRHYRDLSRDTGRTVSELVVGDIEKYHEYCRGLEREREHL